MAINEALYSSRSEEWATPQSVFDILNAEFDFTLDPCATAESAKCARYFTQEQDGLEQDWGRERVFANPPYGKNMIKWAMKAVESAHNGALVVMLAHSRTDTRWYSQIAPHCREIWAVVGRLKFGGAKSSAPFPSTVFVLDGESSQAPAFYCWEYRKGIFHPARKNRGEHDEANGDGNCHQEIRGTPMGVATLL